MKKRIAIIMSALMIIGALAACGNTQAPAQDSSSQSEDSSPAETEPAEGSTASDEVSSGDTAASSGSLHVNWLSARSADEATIKAVKDIAASYKEENPDLDFSFEVENISDRTSYLQKLKILAASDELPEWYDSDPDTWFADIVAAGEAYPIEDLYEELGVADKVYEISKEYARLTTGELNLLTFQCNTEYFFYNKQMFADAGITEIPGTFDELLADCQKLLDKGYTPLTMGGDWPILRYFAMVPFRMTGNDYIVNASKGEISFTEEAGIAGAEFMQKLSPYFQIGWSSADYDTMVDLFASGQTAMMYNGTWAVADLVDESGDLKEDFGVFTMPVLSDNDATAKTDFFANSGIGTAIRADSMTAEMKDFVGYMLNHYAEASLAYDQLPSVMPSDEILEGLPSIYQQVLVDIAGVEKYAKCWDVVIDSASVESLEKETTSLVMGETSPQQWAENMDAIVAENIK